MSYEIRPVRADEWRQVRDLRLHALQDELAPFAFLTTHEVEAAYPDAFWIDRARSSSLDAGPEATARQFVAVSDDGRWVGSVAALVERSGGRDVLGLEIGHDGTHLVGVYLEPGHRGAGLLDRLADAAFAWAREHGLHQARLCVHQDNTRAQAAYRRLGFTPSGRTFTASIGHELEMTRTL